MGLTGVTLRVYGEVYYLRDRRGRLRPVRDADIRLTALAEIQGVLQRIPVFTNPVLAGTDGNGKFDQSTDWGSIGTGQAPPEPEAFDVEVTDPDSGTIVVVGRIESNGDGMVVESGIAPDERPLATAAGGRELAEVPELAAYLAAGLASPDKLGQVTLSRTFFRATDSRFPSAPEKLFRHFANLLDRLQALHLASRQRSPGFDPNHFDLVVPLGFKPLEEKVVATLGWYHNLSAAERIRRLVASYAAAEVTEEVLRRNISRLVGMLSRILALPIEYQRSWYLWEDMAVILTLFTGIGLVAQRNHIVWADFQSNSDGRELILGML